MQDIVAWFRSALSGLDAWLPLPFNISPLALGCFVAAIVLLLLAILLVQRPRHRLLINELASLHSEIDQLKSRIIALEVAERRRQKNALRKDGETQDTVEKNVFTLLPAAPPLQPDTPKAPQPGYLRR